MFSYAESKRKFLFCTDSEGDQNLNILVRQALNENVPFEFHILQEESEERFVNEWFSKQKMGAYLYISGTADFVKRIQGVAMKAGFSEHDMQSLIIGPAMKKLVCCTCHGENEVLDQSQVACLHCGQKLEVSDHYSRRLDAFLGYVTIK
ncbi:dimethylamine monooxygenase subunit DmmA family protein [Mesobacillus sp.]|uniref:dimethylamine monooxygenase subunit DmmA family protein n=1 Tax=Mesobacillus sp. TaxID=2675271 RepID=UPI0039F05743